MSIFSRLNDIINSNVNALLDRAENPEKMVLQMIREMEDTLVEVRTTSAKAIADRKELIRIRDYKEREAKNWQRKAELTLARGREDLTRGALREKQRDLEKVIHLNAEIEQVQTNIDKLSADIAALQSKINDAKSRQTFLVSRSETASAQLRVRQRIDHAKVSDTMRKFEDYERRMDDLESQVESYDLAQKSLFDEISDMEAEDWIEADLKKMKARMTEKADVSAKQDLGKNKDDS